MPIRYVWGDRVGSNRRYLYAMKGVTRCALYIVYRYNPEANVIRAYPERMLVRGSLDRFEKIDLPIMQIYNS
jgi:hypothetical protein